MAGAVLLAACDNDNAVGPNPVTSMPTVPSLAKATGNQQLTITIVDQNANAVTTLAAKFKVANSAGGAGSLVVDNAPSDGNNAVGTIQVKGLAAGSYEVCQTMAPTDYVLPATPCKTVIVGGIVAASARPGDRSAGAMVVSRMWWTWRFSTGT